MLTTLLKLFAVVILGTIVLGILSCGAAMLYPDDFSRALHRQVTAAERAQHHR